MPICGGTIVIKHGISTSKNQRYYCKDSSGINEKIVTMAANASEIRDTSRVLGVSQKKVMST